jgi:flotillin
MMTSIIIERKTPMLNTIAGVGAIVVIVLLLIWFLVSRYKTPTINEAFIISGSSSKDSDGHKATRVLQNKGGFVLPIVNRCVSISLRSHQISTQCDAISQDKIKIQLKVVTNFKVDNTDESIRLAAQRFAKQEQLMEPYVKEIIEGSMRSIVGTMTVESLLGDRAAFSENLRQEVADSINIQGLILDTLQIQEITDQNGYIEALGTPQEAAVKREAAIANANAKQKAQQAQISADQEVASSQKALSLQQAAIRAETNKAEVSADAAKSLEQQAQNKKIAEAEALAEAENVKLQRVKLEYEVNTKADADKYKRKIDAEAQAEVTKQTATAEAEATRLRAQAQADAVKIEGDAKASSIKAQGLAEAEAMTKKADAYKRYGQAALQSLIIEKLPELASAISKPLEGAKITSVGTDANDQTSSLVTNLAAKLPTLVNTLTGVDLSASLRKIAGTDHSHDEVEASPNTDDAKSEK